MSGNSSASGKEPRTPLSSPTTQDTPPPIAPHYGELLQGWTPLAIPSQTVTNHSNEGAIEQPPVPVLALPADPRDQAEGERAFTRADEPPHDKVSVPKLTRTHVIRDRDTLASIAERYYGSADFAGRIFAANRQLLANPDILPVGKVLVLPDIGTSVAGEPLQAIPESPPPASPAPASSSAPTSAAPATQLVPLSGDATQEN